MAANTGKVYNWAIQRTESRLAPLWIGLLFFLEIILFIPLDAILVFFCLQNRKKIGLYVLIAALASTLSGLVGYLFGHFLWDLIGPYVVPYLISQASFERFAHHYQDYESLAVFLGALLPFPLKALSLTAGIFHLGLAPFLSYLLLARTLRFAIVGGAMMLWGEKVKALVDRHFQRILFLLGAKVAMAYALFWIISR